MPLFAALAPERDRSEMVAQDRYGHDGLLDYVQVLHQFSFVALNQQTASRVNLEINAFAMP